MVFYKRAQQRGKIESIRGMQIPDDVPFCATIFRFTNISRHSRNRQSSSEQAAHHRIMRQLSGMLYSCRLGFDGVYSVYLCLKPESYTITKTQTQTQTQTDSAAVFILNAPSRLFFRACNDVIFTRSYRAGIQLFPLLATSAFLLVCLAGVTKYRSLI